MGRSERSVAGVLTNSRVTLVSSHTRSYESIDAVASDSSRKIDLVCMIESVIKDFPPRKRIYAASRHRGHVECAEESENFEFHARFCETLVVARTRKSSNERPQTV